jgi:long-chain acyl-CoA synthetase
VTPPELARVIALVAELCGREAASVGPGTRLTADLGLDSVRAVELALDVEERLGCRIPERRMRDVRTVGDLAAAVAASRDPSLDPSLDPRDEDRDA